MSKRSLENLKPFNKLPKGEQKRISSKAGKASGVARRKKAALRMALDTLLSLEVSDPQTKRQLEDMGLTPDNQALLALSTFQQAIKGNQKAAELIIKTVSNKDVLDIDEQKEKIKGLSLENKKTELRMAGSKNSIVIVSEWKEDVDES
ncbi:stress-induced protein [Streptococcus porcinus]|uniref:Phage protein n=1 Tax=Streptococcus porcinus TaxID=1340 RepID=A0A4V0H6Y9_STRPO|nr:stress-induced protein [Streptococcus porcinus]VTT44582.1 phage protein [Streptococcus porcinus]VTT45935.1 phage protein [Streptococcus porcinus]